MDERKHSAADAYAERFQHRKSSAGVVALEKALNDKVDLVDAGDLSDADRKLAELGYVQVSFHLI